MNEYEQKKEILKQKSDCYEALMTKKLRLDDDSPSPTQFSIETSTGRVLVRNGEVPNEASPTLKRKTLPYRSLLKKPKSTADEGVDFTIETASGQVVLTGDSLRSTQTPSPTPSPVPSNSQEYSSVASHEGSLEPESSELSSQTSSSTAS